MRTPALLHLVTIPTKQKGSQMTVPKTEGQPDDRPDKGQLQYEQYDTEYVLHHIFLSHDRSLLSYDFRHGITTGHFCRRFANMTGPAGL